MGGGGGSGRRRAGHARLEAAGWVSQRRKTAIELLYEALYFRYSNYQNTGTTITVSNTVNGIRNTQTY